LEFQRKVLPGHFVILYYNLIVSHFVLCDTKKNI